MNGLRSLFVIAVSVICGAYLSLFCLAMSPEARKSFEDLEKKAENGDPEAQYKLSAALERGFDSILPDTAKSLDLLRRSAFSGYPRACNYLGYLFGRGEILPLDMDSARFWIAKAADAGDALAAHNLAYMLLNDSARNDSLALLYLNKAADAGLPQSLTVLADLYAEGRAGLPPDTARAVNLYEKAIAANFPDAELRLLNLKGPQWMLFDSETALSEALRYWALGAPLIAVELARQVGPADTATANAYALLGNAYSLGRGVPYDHRKANEYFARAAILGNPAAQFIFAETLEIFPDALSELVPPDLFPESLTPESLRESAARAGIHSAQDAIRAITAP